MTAHDSRYRPQYPQGRDGHHIVSELVHHLSERATHVDHRPATLTNRGNSAGEQQ